MKIKINRILLEEFISNSNRFIEKLDSNNIEKDRMTMKIEFLNRHKLLQDGYITMLGVLDISYNITLFQINSKDFKLDIDYFLNLLKIMNVNDIDIYDDEDLSILLAALEVLLKKNNENGYVKRNVDFIFGFFHKIFDCAVRKQFEADYGLLGDSTINPYF